MSFIFMLARLMRRPSAALLLIALPLAVQAQMSQAPLYGVQIEEAQDTVAAALTAEGVAESVSTIITSTRQKFLYQYKQPLEIQVKTLKHDEADKTWSANLLFASQGEVVTAMPVSGRYEESVRVPVLTARLRNGETIEQDHIAWKEFPASKLRQQTVLDERELIGRTPRRSISVSRPIRADEIQAPDLVAKGSVLKMQYRTARMTITTTGEALESGAEGQSIRVRNKDSGTAIYATVISADEVLVGDTARDLARADTVPASGPVRYWERKRSRP